MDSAIPDGSGVPPANAIRSDIQLRLRVVDGPHAGREFSFAEHRTFVVGRSLEAHFCLPEDDPYVSRLHFLLEVNPPLCRLLDMNSHNGTLVNGHKVEEVLIRSGDRITAGVTTFELTAEQCGIEAPEMASRPEESSAESDWLAWQRRARERGEPWRLRDAIQHHAELVARPQTLVDLIAGEIAFRSDAGEEWSLAEYQRDFPELAEVLAIVLGGEAFSVQSVEGQSIAPPAFPEIPGYRLVRELGRGGMGAVYLAVDEATGRETAIKTILPQFRPGQDAVKRFLREAQILARLDHPRIVNCRGSGTSGDVLYFAMEYVEGIDAAELVRREGAALPIARARDLGLQLLDGLGYAHDKGFVHRDLKPSNLLIASQDGGDLLKIADFGLCVLIRLRR